MARGKLRLALSKSVCLSSSSTKAQLAMLSHLLKTFLALATGGKAFICEADCELHVCTSTPNQIGFKHHTSEAWRGAGQESHSPSYLEVVSLNVGHIHIVSGRADIFVFLPSKDVYANKMHLGFAERRGKVLM